MLHVYGNKQNDLAKLFNFAKLLPLAFPHGRDRSCTLHLITQPPTGNIFYPKNQILILGQNIFCSNNQILILGQNIFCPNKENLMMKLLTSLSLLMLGISFAATAQRPNPEVEKKVDALIAKMTLTEKLGQLNLLVGDLFNTGPTVRTTETARFDEGIRKGEITGLFNIHGAAYVNRLQKIAVEESRLGIPLLIGADVIHGFKTVTPLPLGEAASWDLAAIEASSRVAAIESSASGINWTFAPMVDIARDARWGRIAEGAGEDTYLGSLIAKARVRGFQGSDLSAPNTIAACVKHFAAYGAAEAGRDYNTVDMSEQLLRDVYLPPFKAAVDAGSASLMTSFNELNGVPATGNSFLLDQILRKEWGFPGMVVSDWQSVSEMLAHGNVADAAEATELSIKAGCDMDMMASYYLKELPGLVKSGKVTMAQIDRSVRYVLRMKYALGLFDNPYQASEEREKREVRSAENLAAAFDIAKKSFVLLKNEGNVLPLKKDGLTIAIIGPYADSKAELNGCWSFFGEAEHPVSILEGIKAKVGANTRILTAKGAGFFGDSQSDIAQAVLVAAEADVIILAVGEAAVENGEAGSRADIRLPGAQLDLVKAIAALRKPTVATVIHGRPLDLSWEAENLPAILACWTPGSEGGRAIAEVLFGDYNPSGKLPVSFPRAVGQEPLYYNHKHTGRPYTGDYSEPASNRIYLSKYRDVKTDALYPFGFGLSYTTFSYSDIRLSKAKIGMNESLAVTVDVTNTGKYAGEEVVQLYIRDLVGSITRPVKELKGFQKLSFQPGEKKTVTFTLTKNDLAFWHAGQGFVAEPGQFKVFVGTNSRDVKEAGFELNK